MLKVTASFLLEMSVNQPANIPACHINSSADLLFLILVSFLCKRPAFTCSLQLKLDPFFKEAKQGVAVDVSFGY